MEERNYLIELLGYQGFSIVDMEIERGDDVDKTIFMLDRVKREYVCSGCGRIFITYYDSRIQEVKHLAIWKYQTILMFEKVRVNCSSCGVRVEKLEFLDRYARVTKELAHQISELCKVMTIEDVATLQSLHWETVKEIDKRTIERAQAKRDLSKITVLGIDEISVGRGHKYWHIISSLEGANGP